LPATTELQGHHSHAAPRLPPAGLLQQGAAQLQVRWAGERLEGSAADAMLAADPFLGLGLPNEQELDPYADLLGLTPAEPAVWQPGNWLAASPALPWAAAVVETGPGALAPIQLSAHVQKAIEDAVANALRVSVVRAVSAAVRLATRGQAVQVTQQAQAPPASPSS
jgi:hypothetical protein